MKKIGHVYYCLVRMQLRRYLQFKEDMLVGLIGYAINTLVSLYLLIIFTENVTTFPNWSKQDVLILFGFVTMSRAMWNLFFMNTLEIGELVRSGRLDGVLLKPFNPLLFIIFSKVDLESIGEFLLGTGIFLTYYMEAEYSFSIWVVLKVIVLLMSSTLCYAAIHLCINTLTIYIGDVYALNFIIWRLDETTRYPNHIYPSWLSKVLWFIPYAFIGYFPILVLRNRVDNLTQIGIFLAGFIFFSVVYHIVWKKSLNYYSGVGI